MTTLRRARAAAGEGSVMTKRIIFALLIVGVSWLIGGAMMAFLARNKFRQHGLFPKKTVQVLKADKVWLEQEARTQA